jgi:L-amino acid N-acyltransferase YncA
MTVTESLRSRLKLYKAVKYEAIEFYADHGFSITGLWKEVNTDSKRGRWWRDMCLCDYSERED